MSSIIAPIKAPTARSGPSGLTVLLGAVVAAFLAGGCSASLTDSRAALNAGDDFRDHNLEMARQERHAVSDAGAFAAAPTSSNAAYRIGPLDVLDISVFKVPELSQSVRVADTGMINLPLIGEFPAGGKTAQEIEHELTKQLGVKYLKNPQVRVFVREHNSQQVTIEGAVKRPGVYPIKGEMTLMQLVASAEGVDKDTYSSAMVVFRTVDGARTPLRFDYDDIKAGRASDPALRRGDLVIVDTSAAKTAFQNALKIVPAAGTLAIFH